MYRDGQLSGISVSRRQGDGRKRGYSGEGVAREWGCWGIRERVMTGREWLTQAFYPFGEGSCWLLVPRCGSSSVATWLIIAPLIPRHPQEVAN